MPNKVKHHSGTAMTSVVRLLETALYVADLDRSCDFYKRVLGLGHDIGTTTEVENQKRFRPLQIPGGQVLLLFPKGFATTTAVFPGGAIPPHDGNGRLHLAFAISASELDAWRERLQSHRGNRRRDGMAARRDQPLLSRSRRSLSGACHTWTMVDLLR